MSQDALTPYLRALVKRYFGKEPRAVALIGGGFYGRVYAAALRGAPWRAVIKVYGARGLHRREQTQLALLARYAALRMPEVYFAHDADEEIPCEALIMECLDGVNAGACDDLDDASRRRIADEIVENLLSWHQVQNGEGFGAIGAARYEKDWRKHYRPTADQNFAKVEALYARGQLDGDSLAILRRAHRRYGEIFSEPAPRACLVHGDYNAWNVLLNPRRTHAIAVLDPFGAGWADPELDLYQLDNANGVQLGLLNAYRAQARLSRLFEVKRRYYEAFTEAMHYCDANVDARHSHLPQQAAALDRAMRKEGL